MAYLTVRNLSYAYKLPEQNVPVLNNISLEIEKGEMVAIQGSSGSGKSTLLYLLGGLLHTQQGHILLDNSDLSHMRSDTLAAFRNQKMGYIFQQFHLLPRANILENILLPTQYRSWKRGQHYQDDQKRALELATFLGLEERIYHHPGQLSGGQQQRVAIARALINNPELLLADEPTGNLDSKSSSQILDLLKKLNRQGKTIIIITHDSSVAQICDRVYHIKDGAISNIVSNSIEAETYEHEETISVAPLFEVKNCLALSLHWDQWRQAIHNLFRNKVRTILTMLGITIGIASIIAMLTLGDFTKQKILDSYTELGIRTLIFQGYPQWNSDIRNSSSVIFEAFDWKNDIKPLPHIFPQIKQISPIMLLGNSSVYFGSAKVDDIRIMGLNQHGLDIANKKLVLGKNFSLFHVQHSSSLCIIGSDLVKNLLKKAPPLGQILTIRGPSNSFTCNVIGVLETMPSNREWVRNRDILVPYTFLRSVAKDWWNSRIHELMLEIKPNQDMEKLGKSMKGYFKLKYGLSGQFFPNMETILIHHMQHFLNLFTLLLTTIAATSLAVGGIGVTNMMLVSVSERFREIGLKKALGATDRLIRFQFLLESTVICFFAGILGIFFGVLFYELAIWVTSQFTPKVHFEWVFNWTAFFLSTLSILLVGFLSGLFPAVKAEKLQIIEALRSE